MFSAHFVLIYIFKKLGALIEVIEGLQAPRKSYAMCEQRTRSTVHPLTSCSLFVLQQVLLLKQITSGHIAIALW